MGKETVFQQQARMQSAQIEQNQVMMAQNARQIALMEQAQNEADRAKLLAETLYQAAKVEKRILAIAEQHPKSGYLLALAELEHLKHIGISIEECAPGEQKIRFMEMCEKYEDLQDSAHEPEDADEWEHALLEGFRLRAALGGSKIDLLEHAKEHWHQNEISEAHKKYNETMENNLTTVGGVVKSLLLAVFTCGLWLLALPYLAYSAPKDRDQRIANAESEWANYKVLCASYRKWMESEFGYNDLKKFFEGDAEGWKLIDERYF